MKLNDQNNFGILTNVKDGQMNVYMEGTGEKTLVFMSGGGTPSPLLDFKPLFSTLSKQYRIVVVEKFGYGFSDVVDKERTIESILSDTRSALKLNSINPPYVLCPHSMSGIEALYWVETFPDEVEGIIGLDMATPEVYANYQINLSLLMVLSKLARLGILRFFPKKNDE